MGAPLVNKDENLTFARRLEITCDLTRRRNHITESKTILSLRKDIRSKELTERGNQYI